MLFPVRRGTGADVVGAQSYVQSDGIGGRVCMWLQVLTASLSTAKQWLRNAACPICPDRLDKNICDRVLRESQDIPANGMGSLRKADSCSRLTLHEGTLEAPELHPARLPRDS
jgi:hypothetical protein